jgi:hypothetical protein
MKSLNMNAMSIYDIRHTLFIFSKLAVKEKMSQHIWFFKKEIVYSLSKPQSDINTREYMQAVEYLFNTNEKC